MKKAVLILVFLLGAFAYAQDSIPRQVYYNGRGPFLYVGQESGGGGTDDQTATEVPISDVGGYYTGIQVEAALQEVGADLAEISIAGTGTAINLSDYYQYNMAAASAATTFTTTGVVAGGYAEILINASSEPTVTGATKIPNTATFIVSTDMILHIKAFGSTVKYWFTEF